MRNAKWIYKVWFTTRFALAAVLLMWIFTGCAEKGPILLTIGYQAPGESIGSVSTTSVGVSPFRDARGKPASVLGKRTIPNGQENDFTVRGTVAEIVTVSLKKALVSRGFKVKDVAGWDLTAEGMKDEGTALLLGGEIKHLWLESTGSTVNTHLQASVQLRIVAGDTEERKILRAIDVSSRLDHDIFYSQEELEQALSEALSSAIDQFFKDEELKKRF